MNRIEYDIITRCLHILYGQLLTDETGQGLRSVERLIALVRYMARAESPTSALEEELQIIQQVFQIYQAEFRVELKGLDARASVPHNHLLYEICRHGMELLHNGCRLERVTLFQTQEGQLAYTFSDFSGQTYGGMIYGEDIGPEDRR